MPKSRKGSKGKAKAKPKEAKAEPNGEPKKDRKEEEKKPKGRPKKEVPADVEALRAKAAEAKAALDTAAKEAESQRAKADEAEAAAKATYVEALGPYREACRKAGVECEFAGARAANKTPAVRFLVEKVKDGVKVAIKGRPETEEVIPRKAVEESVGKAAFAYTDKWIGPRDTIGAKGAYVAGCSYVGSISSSAGEGRKAA